MINSQWRQSRFQFTLRAVLLTPVFLSVPLAWIAVKVDRARRQKAAVELIQGIGGAVQYDYQDGAYRPSGPPAPAWLRKLFGEDFFAKVVGVHFAVPIDHHIVLQELPDLDTLRGCLQPYVTWVEFYHTFSDSQLKAVMEVLPSLQELDISNTQVTDIGAEKLKALRSLEFLDLSGTHVTDQAVEHLEALPNLRYLNLQHTRVTRQGVNRLEQALPRCEVVY